MSSGPVSSGQSSPASLRPLIGDFLEDLAERRGASSHTVRNYGSDLAQFAEFLEASDAKGGDRPRGAPVDTGLLRAYLASLHERGLSSTTVARKLAALRRHCEAEGRDYDSIEKTLMLLNIHMTDDPADVTRFLERRVEERSRSAIADRPLEDLRRTHMVGTPEDMSALIREHIANGFTHFAVQVLHPYDYTAIERFYNEVAVPLKREHGQG